MNWNSLFNPENRFWRFMEKIADVFFLGVLWFIFSIPLITMGAATTAVYQFTLKQVDDEEGHVWRSFWTAFRKNFLPATVLWLILLAVGLFLAADIWLCMNLSLPPAAQIPCFGVLICLAVLWFITALYTFPILSRFDLPVKKILPHAFVTAVGNLYVTVTVVLVHLVFAYLCNAVLILFPVFVTLAAFVSSYFFRSVFARYRAKEADSGPEPED